MAQTFRIDGIPLKYGDAEFVFYNIKELSLHKKSESNSALHAHAYFELHFMIKGQYLFHSIDKSLKLGAGQYLILLPGFAHYSALVDDSFSSIVIPFQLKKCSGKKGMYDYFYNSLVSNSFMPIRASEALMDDVITFKDISTLSGTEALCLRKARLTDFVYQMFKGINDFTLNGEKSLINEDKSDILFLLDHMVTSGSYTINDIAERTGYSPRSISRLITAIYKMPLSEIKRKYSIETAKELLEKGGKSMEEIAGLSGFKNTSAMRTAFKKCEGITPSAYKSPTNKRRDEDED